MWVSPCSTSGRKKNIESPGGRTTLKWGALGSGRGVQEHKENSLGMQLRVDQFYGPSLRTMGHFGGLQT